MENRSFLYQLDIRLWALSLGVLNTAKARGIECAISTPKGEKNCTNVRFTVLLNGEPTIDEILIARTREIVRSETAKCCKTQGAVLVANGLLVYVKNPKTPLF